MGPGLENSLSPFTDSKGGSVACQDLLPSVFFAPEVTVVRKIPKAASWTPAPLVYLLTGQLYSDTPTIPQAWKTPNCGHLSTLVSLLASLLQ